MTRTSASNDGFLSVIRASPEDDTPRLIYADWLDDHDEPERAELIRLQVERAAVEGEAGAIRRQLAGLERQEYPPEELWFLTGIPAALEDGNRRHSPEPSVRRESHLLTVHQERWLEGLACPVEFRRGFPEVLSIGAQDYLRSLAILERIAPVQAVCLTRLCTEEDDDVDWEEQDQARLELAEQLAGCPMLGRWVELEFVECPGYEVYEVLLRSPHLTNLRRLVAINNEIGEGVAEVASANFTHLRWLDLYDSNSAGGRPGDDDFIAIVTCPHLAKLEYLNFGSSNATVEGVAALASSPSMSRLRSLCLSSNDVSGEGLRILARSTTLSSLQHLDLSSCCVHDSPDDADLADLLESPLFAQLTYLSIHSNRVSDEGIERLARAPAATKLRVLVIGGTGYMRSRPEVTAASVRSLAASPHLSGLRRLELRQVSLDDELAGLLADSPGLHDLRELTAEHGLGLTAKGEQVLRRRFGDGVILYG